MDTKTEEQRLLIYKAMLKELRVRIALSSTVFGFCWLSREVQELNFNALDPIRDLIELLKYKPKQLVYSNGEICEESSYWFDINEKGTARRMQILEEIIFKMENHD